MAVIYRHLKPCGEVFYIGIGGESKRAYDRVKRNRFWKHVFEKYPNYEVEILKSDLEWEDACELEIILIAYYGRRDLGVGTLVNLTDGGEGAPGHIKSEESKRKISVAKLGEKKPKETIAKRSATRIAKNELIKKYICTESLKTWGTITKCAEDIGITHHMLANYLDPNRVERNTSTIMRYEDYLKYGVIPPLPKVNEKIASINVETKVIFNSIRSASMSIGIDHGTLKRKLTGKSTNDTSFMLLSEYEEIYGKVNN